MAKCDNCGKTKMFGHTIQYHHGGKWERRAPKKNRVFLPNIQKTKVMVNGVMRTAHLCTRCMRTLQKA